MIYAQTSANTRLQQRSDAFIKCSCLNRNCIKINVLLEIFLKLVRGTYQDLKQKKI